MRWIQTSWSSYCGLESKLLLVWNHLYIIWWYRYYGTLVPFW
jgi:hypothetical protein